jgi:hypothetical protein
MSQITAGSMRRYLNKHRTLQTLAKDFNSTMFWNRTRKQHPNWHEFIIEDRGQDWEEVSSWVLNQFGAPGARYITSSSTRIMRFLFRDAKDYAWMALKWSS